MQIEQESNFYVLHLKIQNVRNRAWWCSNHIFITKPKDEIQLFLDEHKGQSMEIFWCKLFGQISFWSHWSFTLLALAHPPAVDFYILLNICPPKELKDLSVGNLISRCITVISVVLQRDFLSESDVIKLLIVIVLKPNKQHSTVWCYHQYHHIITR